MTSHIKIGFLNVRSIVPSIQGVKQIILENAFDIFGVCETWLHDGISTNLIKVQGFKIFRRDRLTRGGGVCLYVKNSLNNSVINVSNAIEQLWVNVKLKKENIAVGIVYKSPALDTNLFLDELDNTLSQVLPTVNDIVCIGDFNINMFNLTNVHVNNLNSILEGLSLTQIIDTPTRLTDFTATLIDLILVAKEVNLIERGTMDNDLSDHQIVYCIKNICSRREAPRMVTYRYLKNFDYENFEQDLFSIPFFSIYDMHNVDEKVTYFTNALVELFDRHAPLVTSRVNRPPAPWLTDVIKIMMSTRDKALSRYKQSKIDAHWQFYKQIRNFTLAAIKRERKAYLTRKIDSSTPKEYWKILKSNSIVPQNKITDIPVHLKNADVLNDYFVNALPLTTASDEILTFYRNNTLCNQTFSFVAVDEFAVYETVNQIKSNAPGCDGLNITLIKLCCPHIIPYFTHIINYCLLNNVFPVMWKSAVVTVLPKKSNPEEYKDLRAISILPAFSKIIEKIMEKQLRVYLLENEVIPTFQSGFRPGYSCSTALLHVVDDIMGATDQGLYTVLVLLDFSRAFDTLNFDMLKAILHYIGLEESAVRLFNNYLTNRKQKVSIENVESSYIMLKSGVPQGSILGPLLFTVYTSQFIKCLKYCLSHFYADDSQVYYSFSAEEVDNACLKINEDLTNFVDSARGHCLVINATKSNVILFGPKVHRSVVKNSVKICIDDNQLEVVDQAKSLGVILDSDLRFESYVNKLIQRCYAAIKLIYGNRHYLPQKTRAMLCESLVLSVLNYSDVLYGPNLTALYRKKIQKIQNSCLRLIFGIRRYERISYKLRDLGWLNMANRRFLHAACQYHKIIVSKTPPYLYQKITFRTDVHSLNVRFKGLLTPPLHRTEYFKRSYRYQICYVYNSIPNIYKAMRVGTFKTNVKSLLLNRQ